MAENFEAYHVPQQSRRDKLRVVIPNHPGCVENLQGCSGLLPLYDPSLISSDLLTCASFHHPLGDNSKSNQNQNQNQGCGGGGVKEEGMNLMRYVGGIINASSSSSTSQHMFMDPHSSMSMHINPTSIQDVNNHPFLYNHSFNGNEVVVYKPEPLSMAHEPNTTGGQGLSLSLSSHHNHNHNNPQTNLPLELNLQRYESSVYADKVTLTGGYLGSTSNDLSRSTVPLGPFTGYASILKGSRFLKPAQQLLEELCNVGCGIYAEKITADSTLLDPPSETLSRSGIVDDPSSCGDGSESRRKKSRLISMLDEVYRRYKQYYQQMQAVVASFETVAGLSNAAPFANLALKAMSKHFRCLKKAITDQLQFTTKFHGHMSYVNDETLRSGNDRGNLYGQRPINNLGFMDHQPVWRPQRGLPERAVTVLRAWLFEHFLHPYPTDTDKLMLAKQTGLSRNQVSNWFINARVRLWKPMVEEIHTLETRQAQKPSERHDQNTNRINDHLSASENPSTSTHRVQDLPSKRTRNDFPNNPMGNEEPMNLLYDNSSRHSHGGVGVSSVNGPGGVSLTLGLHQNNGIGLSDPFPMNAARRFGLDANSDGFVMGAFEAQNRQFGRDMMGGGQLLHDFVG